MQPIFLPWSEFFNLISKVDKFVLDDAQYSKIAGKIEILFYK